MPLGEGDDGGQLHAAQRVPRQAPRDEAQPRARPRVVEESLEVLADRPEVPRSVEKQSLGVGRGEQPDAFGHVAGVEQLVPVPATPQDEDGPAEPDPLEDDGEGSHALGPDEGFGPHDGHLQPSHPVLVRHPLRLRPGCPVRVEPAQRRIAKDRVRAGGLRHDGGRDQDDASDTLSERPLAHAPRALNVHAAHHQRRVPRGGESRVDHHVDVIEGVSHRARIPDVASDVLHCRVEVAAPIRLEVEQPDLRPFPPKGPRQMCPEEARSSGDQHSTGDHGSLPG